LALAAALVTIGAPALAGPAPDSAAASKLKWQSKRSPAERSAAQTAQVVASAPVASAPAAAIVSEPVTTLSVPPASAPVKAAPRELPRTIGAKPLPLRRGVAVKASATAPSDRTRTRDMVMQVSADKADPFKDPFEDEPVPGVVSEQRTQEPGQLPTPDLTAPTVEAPPDATAPGIEPPTSTAPPAATEADEPPPMRDDPTLPLPAEQSAPSFDQTTPDNRPVVEGTMPPLDMSCDEYKSECNKAIEVLRNRDITKIIFGIVIEGEGGAPPVEGKDYPCECVLGINTTFQGRHWSPTTFTWKATAQCHKPLYFEDVQLERYGHSWNPVLQPFVSAGHFFVSVPLLPYKMGLTPPGECMYTLGYYRPGDCAPYMIEPIPLSLRAGVSQALGTTAFAFWFWPPPTGP
jgi:hypothetical protein